MTDITYKRKYRGTTNFDLELKRIHMRVEKKLLTMTLEIKKKEKEQRLARKYVERWRGFRLLCNLVGLRRVLIKDLFNVCDLEIITYNSACTKAIETFNNIRRS